MKARLAPAAALAVALGLPGTPAWSSQVDVTGDVSLAYTGYVYNRGTGTFDTQATLTNHAAALAAPVELAVTGLPSGITLANADGKTATGAPFINVGTTGIAQGASASVILKFSDPLHATVSFKPQVLAGASGTVLTPAQRDAALHALQLKWNQVVSSGADFASGMLTYMKARPELTGVVADGEGGVSAQFLDGRLLSVQHNLDVVHGAVPAAAALRSISPAAASVGLSMPAGKKAVVAMAFDSGYTGFTGLNSDVSQWLRAAGYKTVVAQTGVTPAFLRTNVKNVDVLLYTGHGGATSLGRAAPIEGFGVSTGVVMSDSDPKTPKLFPAESADDSADFAAGRLGYMINTVAEDPQGNPVSGTYWAFTDSFVLQYMSFTPGSFVFFNTCFSEGAHANSGFVGAALSKGASTYLGWIGKTSDTGGTRPRYLFDRMLGEVPNGGGRTNVSQESPPQRAFNLGAVVQALTDQGLLPLPDGSTLQISGSADSILAPSIATLAVDEFNNKLLVSGLFDTSATALQNTVISVNGTPLCQSAQAQGPDVISCPIPVTGAQSDGPVTVTAYGIDSNTVNLTSWQGTFHQQITGGGSIKESADMFVHWRGDIHLWRLKPHGPPSFFPHLIGAATDSTLNWSISGNDRVPGPPDQTLSVSGGGSIPLVTPSHLSPPFFTMGFVVDPTTQNAWILPDGVGSKLISVSGNACTGAGDFVFFVDPAKLAQVGIWAPLPPAANATITIVPMVPTPISSSFSLLSNQLPGIPEFGCPYAIASSVTSKVTVPAVTAAFPPDRKAAQ